MQQYACVIFSQEEIGSIDVFELMCICVFAN